MEQKKFWQLVRGCINTTITEHLLGVDSWPEYLESLNNTKDGRLEGLSQSLSQKAYYSLREEDYKFISPITHEEISKALKPMKGGSAPGTDGIPMKIWKWGKTYFAAILISLFSVLVSSCKWPEEWSLSAMIPLFKKGDRSHHNNYQGIHLRNSLPKLFCKVLDFGLRRWIEKRDVLDKVHVGFREGFGTSNYIFSLQALVNKYTSAKKGRLHGIYRY